MASERIIGLIPARGGSKGIPGKNIRNLAGKPLIAWTIEKALNSKVCSRVIVSTDNHDIKKISEDFGAEVPFLRPPHLATDTSTSISVVNHAIEFLFNEGINESDYILLLQPTSPFRKEEDIKNILNLSKSRQAEAVISVTEIFHHPYKTHIINSNGYLERILNNCNNNIRRQDLPQMFAENGALYLNKVFSLLNYQTFIPTRKTYPYFMPPERLLDIDSYWDFHLAELIMNDNRINEK